MDKLTRYLAVGAVLIVGGVGLVALSGTSLSYPAAASVALLGAIGIILGIVMVIGAMWIDLSHLNAERSQPRQ
jgi:uncharacterized membrane protein HdeD (DUF308 family)